ncbi:Beta-lactamase-like protein [Penicillium subrubescens]|uniref:Beta-lactamase-like protein n=1 Tax=Penicillium subrubescens TaxID=1316194 RepID=A0A1Q5UIL9_9EURO|nr:Beta-lactamase-like protein [Penicillium subrubescens]
MLFDKVLVASLLGFAASSSAATIVAIDEVPLIGPAFISNFDPSNSTAIHTAKSKFPRLIENLFSKGTLNKTDLAFSVDVFSAATNKSIYSYSHVGKDANHTLTAGVLNDKTIARIGSVTKLFTAYALIAKGGMEVLSQPVTKFLPELAGNSSDDRLLRLRWEDITVGALAAQQAGTGGPGDFLNFMRDDKRPVISPFRNAIYSDAGYTVLGQVVARLAGKKTYSEAIRDILFKPLSLDNMSTKAPKGSGLNAIDRSRIDKSSSWGLDLEVVASSGGIYANGADLRAAGLSILNSELLSPANTSEWMKPRSGTGTLVELVGAPWEISRLEIPVSPGSNRTRISDLYTKAGGNKDYTTIFALSPDHGIGFSILIAGDTATPARWPLRDTVGQTFIPAAEHAAWENAKRNLAGTFVDKSTPGTNLTLTVDKGRPGLGLGAFWVKGQNGRDNPHWRLYPTGLNSISRSLSALYRSQGKMRVAHRMAEPEPPMKPRAAVEGGKGGLFDNSFTWMNIDFAGPADEFIFDLVDGRLVSVELPVTGMVLHRVE